MDYTPNFSDEKTPEEIEYERLLVKNEFSEIIKHHEMALTRIARFKKGYPYMIAPNIYEMITENLKDNISMLLRELPNIEKNKKREYQKKYVCRMCQKVFLISLPDNLCDECRGRYGL